MRQTGCPIPKWQASVEGGGGVFNMESKGNTLVEFIPFFLSKESEDCQQMTAMPLGSSCTPIHTCRLQHRIAAAEHNAPSKTNTLFYLILFLFVHLHSTHRCEPKVGNNHSSVYLKYPSWISAVSIFPI